MIIITQGPFPLRNQQKAEGILLCNQFLPLFKEMVSRLVNPNFDLLPIFLFTCVEGPVISLYMFKFKNKYFSVISNEKNEWR